MATTPTTFGADCLGVEPLARRRSGQPIVVVWGPGGAMDGGALVWGLWEDWGYMDEGHDPHTWAAAWKTSDHARRMGDIGVVPLTHRCLDADAWTTAGVDRVVTLPDFGVAIAAPGRALSLVTPHQTIYSPTSLRVIALDDGALLVAGRGYGGWVAPVEVDFHGAPTVCPAVGETIHRERWVVRSTPGGIPSGLADADELSFLGEASCVVDAVDGTLRSWQHVWWQHAEGSTLGWVLSGGVPGEVAVLPYIDPA